MKKMIISAALIVAGFSAPAFAQDAAPADLGGFRLEGLATYEGNDGENIGYGVGIGYDARAGGVLLGVEAEAVRPGDKECETSPILSACARTERDLYIGGRIGVPLGSNALAYVKAGYTNVAIESVIDLATEPPYNLNYKLDGARIGGGVQLGLGGNLYVKAEYRYSDYENGFNKHTGVAGVGFRF
jgi:outer membrane immunogenic protein